MRAKRAAQRQVKQPPSRQFTTIYAYLQDVEQAYALPSRTVREYPGFTADELATMLDGFETPHGYTLIDKHENWACV